MFAKGLVDLLSTTKWMPDVVALPPTAGMRTTLAVEVAQIATMKDSEIHRALQFSVEHSWVKRDIAWLEGRNLGRRISGILSNIWGSYVRPDWPRRRLVLERDVMHRARLLAAHGWPQALKNLSVRSEWIGVDSIRFSSHAGSDRRIGDNGLQFVPVSLSGGSWLCENASDDYALVYPARGGRAATAEMGGPALDRLIGENRARIMSELAQPATASELSNVLKLSLGTVGWHLKVLRDAELIIATRMGHRVVYSLTLVGEALLGRGD